MICERYNCSKCNVPGIKRKTKPHCISVKMGTNADLTEKNRTPTNNKIEMLSFNYLGSISESDYTLQNRYSLAFCNTAISVCFSFGNRTYLVKARDEHIQLVS